MRDVMRSGLLISGMFRSGTTLLSRMFSAYPECLVVSDPFVYFFKAYRNFHLARVGAQGWLPDEPTPDYFGATHGDLLQPPHAVMRAAEKRGGIDGGEERAPGGQAGKSGKMRKHGRLPGKDRDGFLAFHMDRVPGAPG